MPSFLMSNYDGVYSHDPHFAPVLDELNRKAVPFVHRTDGPAKDQLTQGFLTLAFEQPDETTCMVASPIDGDTTVRHRRCAFSDQPRGCPRLLRTCFSRASLFFNPLPMLSEHQSPFRRRNRLSGVLVSTTLEGRYPALGLGNLQAGRPAPQGRRASVEIVVGSVG